MAIKVTLGEAKPQEVKPFPKLMVSNDGRTPKWIIYALSEKEVFHIISPHSGEYTYSFFMGNDFTDYNEPITLQNQ